MPKINAEHINVLLNSINEVPYLKLLSMKVCELGIGYSKAEVNIQEKHMNPFGEIHGGVYSSILDTAA